MQLLRKVPYRTHEEPVPKGLETAVGLAAEPTDILILDYTRFDECPRHARMLLRYVSGAVVPVKFTGQFADGRDAVDCAEFVLEHLCQLFPEALLLYRRRGLVHADESHVAGEFVKAKEWVSA